MRTEKLFMEDKIMFLSLIPLLIRMGFVHVVMIWGTNNTKTAGLSQTNIQHREIGSRLVLASRIFYAAFIWTAKYTVSEFLKRVIGRHWRRSYEFGLYGIRYFLLITFVAVVIATLAECQPFDHYWQVVPDPGPKCREGLAQLITMGVCYIITDVLLVIYPIPIVIASAMPLKRKFSLTLLFMLSLGLVGITAYRIPAVISRKGAQQFRTLIASLEILAATAVSNAIVIGSFIRDRGAKKAKYKMGSVDGNSIERTPTRRTTVTMHHWGSDADLVSDLGLGVHPDLHSRKAPLPRPAPVAMPPSSLDAHDSSTVGENWRFPQNQPKSLDSDTSASTDPKDGFDEGSISPGPKLGDTHGISSSPRKMSFFDVGGLLDPSPIGTSDEPSQRTSRSHSIVYSQDFAGNPPSTADSVTPLRPQIHHQQPPSPNTTRRSSRVFLSDVGGLLSSHVEEGDARESSRTSSRTDASASGVRNFSRGSSAYARAAKDLSSMSSQQDLEEGEEEEEEEEEEDEDDISFAHPASRGGTSSLIAALATGPPTGRYDTRRTNGAPRRPSDTSENGDGPILMDPGGLLS